jgi:hypothetical protein
VPKREYFVDGFFVTTQRIAALYGHFILVAVAEDDREEAAAIAFVAQHAGWRVASPDLTAAPPHASTTWVDLAAAVVAVWSSSTAIAPAVADLAHAAARAGKLVLVVLDHCPHPFAAHMAIDLSQWRDKPDIATRSALVRAIDKIAGSPKPIARSLWRRRLDRLPKPVKAAAVGATLVLLTGGIATALIQPAKPTEPALRSALRDPPARPWAEIDKSRPDALAAFLASNPEGGAADEARRTLERLDARAWVAVAAAQGAAERLQAVARYQHDFPNGRRRGDAARLAELERETIARVQALLEQLDMPINDPRGAAGRATTTAVASFQANQGLAVDGRITGDLVIELEAAVLAEDQRSAPR